MKNLLLLLLLGFIIILCSLGFLTLYYREELIYDLSYYYMLPPLSEDNSWDEGFTYLNNEDFKCTVGGWWNGKLYISYRGFFAQPLEKDYEQLVIQINKGL